MILVARVGGTGVQVDDATGLVEIFLRGWRARVQRNEPDARRNQLEKFTARDGMRRMHATLIF